MKTKVFLLSLVVAVLTACVPAYAAMTIESPKKSPSLGEWDDAKLTDENLNRMPIWGVVFPNENGETGLDADDLVKGSVSQVTGKEEPPLYKLSSGKKIPLMALSVINPTTKLPVPMPLQTSVGDSLQVYVDCNGGSDANGLGTVAAPWQSLKYAQANIESSLEITRTIHVKGVCNEDNDYVPALNLLVKGDLGTYVHHQDSSEIVLAYGSVDSVNSFDGINFDGAGFIMQRDAASTGYASISFDGSSIISLQGVGAGDDGLIGADDVSLHNSALVGQAVLNSFIVHMQNSTITADFTLTSQGVDGVNTSQMVSTFFNNRMGRLKMFDYSAVLVRDTNLNKVFLHDVNTLIEHDVASSPVSGTNFLDGALNSQEIETVSRLKLSGGTMSGEIDMDSNKIVNLPDPSDPQDAATKAYVDKIAVYSSAASAGGAATEALAVTGLLATDTILAVSQETPGANGTAINGWSALGVDTLTLSWTANPGAGAVVKVLVKH